MTDTVKVPRELLERITDESTKVAEIMLIPRARAIAELRALLAAEPPAVEEVSEAEVVAFLMKSDTYGSWLAFFRDQSADVTEPLMTVSQHNRIVSRLK